MSLETVFSACDGVLVNIVSRGEAVSSSDLVCAEELHPDSVNIIIILIIQQLESHSLLMGSLLEPYGMGSIANIRCITCQSFGLSIVNKILRAGIIYYH